MAQLIDITKVAVAPQHFTARVTIANGGPLTTDQDLVGTTHVYNLLPDIIEHACLGDRGATFKDVMGATEVAHLLEHVAIELMARTGIAGDISCGRTWEVTGEPRTYDVQLACPDDVERGVDPAVGLLGRARPQARRGCHRGGHPLARGRR